MDDAVDGCALGEVHKMFSHFMIWRRITCWKCYNNSKEKTHFQENSFKRHYNVNCEWCKHFHWTRTHFIILIIIAFRYFHLTSNSRNRINLLFEIFPTFQHRNKKQPQVIKKKFGNNRIQQMNYYLQQRLICNETLQFFGTCFSPRLQSLAFDIFQEHNTCATWNV